jgi:hypothetical protein
MISKSIPEPGAVSMSRLKLVTAVSLLAEAAALLAVFWRPGRRGSAR